MKSSCFMAMADWDVIRAEAMTCRSTQELNPQDMFSFSGNQMMTEMDMPQSLVKFGKTSGRAVEESRERSADRLFADQLFADLEPVASAVEGGDFGTAGDPFEPTARCISDTRKRQLVSRSGLPKLRCCVCHLHGKRAMHSAAAVRFFQNGASTSVSLPGCHCRRCQRCRIQALQKTRARDTMCCLCVILSGTDPSR